MTPLDEAYERGMALGLIVGYMVGTLWFIVVLVVVSP